MFRVKQFRNRKPCCFGSKKTNKQKTHKHFSDGPCGTIVPGTNPHPSQGQTGQNADFTVELNRERPVCPGDGSHFVPGRGPICPRDGFLFVPDTVLPKMFMFIGYFFPDCLWFQLLFAAISQNFETGAAHFALIRAFLTKCAK